MKNSGAAMPREVPKMVSRSTQEPRRTAASTPSGTEISSPIRMAPAVSDRVVGSRSRIRSVTGLPDVKEVPRSPRSTAVSQCQNCTGNGWSRPRRWRAASIASSEALSPATTEAGSPGVMWISRKVISPTSTSIGMVESSRRAR